MFSCILVRISYVLTALETRGHQGLARVLDFLPLDRATHQTYLDLRQGRVIFVFPIIFLSRFLERSPPIQGTLDQRSARPREGAQVSWRVLLTVPVLYENSFEYFMRVVGLRPSKA